MTGKVRLWAILTALAGIAVVLVGAGFGHLPEVREAAAVCRDAQPSVVAFELARTADEARAMFACGREAVAGMDAVNRLDLWAYIPAYTLFAVFAAVFAARGARPAPVLLAILAAVVALVADYVETTTLLAITAGLAEATDAMTVRASTAAWTKFGALAVHGLLVALACFRTKPRRWIVGAAMVLPALGAVAAVLGYVPLMMLGLSVGWLAPMIFAAKESVWPPEAA